MSAGRALAELWRSFRHPGADVADAFDVEPIDRVAVHAVVLRHDLDHVAETAERIIKTTEVAEHALLAAHVSDAADALLHVVEAAPSGSVLDLSTLTRTARILGAVLAPIDPQEYLA